MEITCNIVLADGNHIKIDGFDTIHFYEQIPYTKFTYSGYDLQKHENDYYSVMNFLNEYKFIGIERNDSENELTFGGKDFVYKNYSREIVKTIEKNEILYIKTDCISTITVYEQWS